MKTTARYAKWLLRRKPYTSISRHQIHQVDENATSSFFGYYDKSPLNHAQTSIMYHVAACDTATHPNPNIPIQIVVRHRATNEVTDTLKSTAYNWQQGTRAQWLSDARFIYNDYDWRQHAYQSHIYDINMHKTLATMPAAIYDCYSDAFALTLNFKRLAILAPDYGYSCGPGGERLPDLDRDGVWRLDLLSGETKLIVSLSEILAIAPTPIMNAAQHSVNHIMISPDGSKFVVIHRWYRLGRRHDRLFLAEADGSALTLLANEDMVSHCSWLSHSRLLCYMRHDGKSSYYCIDTANHAIAAMGEGAFDKLGDGHPSSIGTRILFDTYPNGARMQRLFLYDTASSEIECLGEFFAPLRFAGPTRCDLHPRFSPDGTRIFFDSTHTGIRQLYEMDLSRKADWLAT